MTLRVLFVYILYSSANDNLNFFYLYDAPGLEGLYRFVGSLFTVVEFLIFSWIFLRVITGRLRRSIIVFCMVTFVIFSALNYLFAPSIAHYDSLPIIIEGILVLIFCLFYFFEQISGPPTSLIYTKTDFWIVLGIMIYISLGFFLFLQASIASLSTISKFWDINLVSNILKNIIFAIAFVINDEKESDSLAKRHYSTF